ncbi:hypothetical protein C3486_06050 [Streptomyces sp. Ru73]|uniref:hypothetical protein n=1 Tax=Streptomyces sp. Ru73 TaxID=2080748 RepID=UPI000CDCE651|nr:hypothetical protein [Streptomyces sp. Ru73]POX42292.1 hypothetical protein C3486_06050 [Streptomyces sp. Ru73]
MLSKQRLIRAGVTVFLMAGLAACGSGTGGQGGSGGHGTAGGSGTGKSAGDVRPQSDGVSGLRAGVRHVTKKTARATRPHLVKECEPATKRVKHTKRSGRTKKTWYTTERYQDCHKVRRGTESYRRVVRPERWCVRLDDVNGQAAKDGIWYRVTSATYHTALGKDDHARLHFTPTRTGC